MEDALEGIEDEFKFAQEMKDTCCDELGKETNPAKAAEILHQIGLIYKKRSPDKISLIKSAGLLNAAIVRNPSNVSQIKSDLSDLCRHILATSTASDQTADLIEKSEQVKESITKLRNEVKEFLKSKLPKIKKTFLNSKQITSSEQKTKKIQELNRLIARKYKQTMINLSQYCENVMGKPPCQYAVVGMGSIAREEITPYSDFEHIILLCDHESYSSYLEYFRWFSVIFHIVVLNVQETIIPSLNIASLNGNNPSLGNWFYDAITPSGLSFDGMMPHACKFPLGRQQHTKNKQFKTELIKPVSEMLEYLTSDADLKNGYHLADILTKTCFVFGNEDIFKQFANGAQIYHKTKSRTEIIKDIQQQVQNDLNKFSTRFRLRNLKSQHTINIKQLVYRSTTIFISALARKHNISANSCFDIIDEMANNKQITQNTGEKLKFAIAVACEMRLRIYVDENSQCDNAIDLKQNGIQTLLDIVGVTCTINYFQIAYCLQCEVAKQLNFTKLHFYTDPQLINITIGLAFGMKDFASFSEESQKQNWDSSKFDFDACIEQLERKIKFNTTTNTLYSTDLNTQQIESIANYLNSAEIFDEALEFYTQLLDIYESKPSNKNRDYHIAMIKQQIGSCWLYLNEPIQALIFSQQALDIRKNSPHSVTYIWEDANAWNNLGVIHLHLHNYDEALTSLNRSLAMKQIIPQNADLDRDFANTLHNIGWCHNQIANYDEALTNLNRALKIKQNISVDVDKDRSMAQTQRGIGKCLTGWQRFDDSWNYLQQSLKICQNTSLDEGKDIDIVRTFIYMGECLMGKQQHTEALIHLQKASKIYQTQINWEKDPYLATALNNLRICLMELQEKADAISRFKELLQIYEKLTPSAHIESKIESVRCKIDEYS